MTYKCHTFPHKCYTFILLFFVTFRCHTLKKMYLELNNIFVWLAYKPVNSFFRHWSYTIFFYLLKNKMSYIYLRTLNVLHFYWFKNQMTLRYDTECQNSFLHFRKCWQNLVIKESHTFVINIGKQIYCPWLRKTMNF